MATTSLHFLHRFVARPGELASLKAMAWISAAALTIIAPLSYCQRLDSAIFAVLLSYILAILSRLREKPLMSRLAWWRRLGYPLGPAKHRRLKPAPPCLTTRIQALADLGGTGLQPVGASFRNLLGLLALRGAQQRPCRALGYALLPAVYVLTAGLIEIPLLLYKPNYPWPGLIVVSLGVPVYYIWRRKAVTR